MADFNYTDWSLWKSICVTTKNLNNQFVDNGDYITVVGPDANDINFVIMIPKLLEDGVTPNPDYTDFTTNVQPACNFPVGTRPYPFSTSDFTFDGEGISGVCTAGQTLTLDFQIDPTKYPNGQNINGGRAIHEGSVFGDYIECQVVDKSNLLPAPYTGAVLSQWITSWYLPSSPIGTYAEPLALETPYAARVPAGMWLRLIYTSTGSANVNVAVNYNLHTPI